MVKDGQCEKPESRSVGQKQELDLKMTIMSEKRECDEVRISTGKYKTIGCMFLEYALL